MKPRQLEATACANVLLSENVSIEDKDRELQRYVTDQAQHRTESDVPAGHWWLTPLLTSTSPARHGALQEVLVALDRLRRSQQQEQQRRRTIRLRRLPIGTPILVLSRGRVTIATLVAVKRTQFVFRTRYGATMTRPIDYYVRIATTETLRGTREEARGA